MKITVETADFRQALISVAPHAHPDPDMPQLHRIRVEVGPENVTVSATNQFTIGHALVSLWDNHDGELTHFDLSPQDVKEILALFHGKPGKDGEKGDSIQLVVTDDHTTITDVSGLFEGKALQLPRYATAANFPSVEDTIRGKLVRGRKSAERLITSGPLLALFTKAAAAYGEPLVFDPAGNSAAMLVTCGESFVGLLMPQRDDDTVTAKLNRWHQAWLSRIDTKNPAATR